jgi:hypothetical protein
MTCAETFGNGVLIKTGAMTPGTQDPHIVMGQQATCGSDLYMHFPPELFLQITMSGSAGLNGPVLEKFTCIGSVYNTLAGFSGSYGSLDGILFEPPVNDTKNTLHRVQAPGTVPYIKIYHKCLM